MQCRLLFLNVIIVWFLNVFSTLILLTDNVYSAAVKETAHASRWSAGSHFYIKSQHSVHIFVFVCVTAIRFFLRVLRHNNRSVMRWAKLNWGPDVVGLSVGSQQQPFPLGELPGVRGGGGGGGVGIRPVYSPPIINTAGKPTPHCYCCLLLFILCPCLLPHL